MFDLTPHNTFALRAMARDGLEIRSKADLDRLPGGPYLVLGGGSDVLLLEDFSGTALLCRIGGMETEELRDGGVRVRLGGGVPLDGAIAELGRQGIHGLENLSLIPGLVGAAPIQNVGAYGLEIGELIERVEARDLLTGEDLSLSAQECGFSYRDSALRHWEGALMVTAVTLRLSRRFSPCLAHRALEGRDFADARSLRDFIIGIRSRKLPDCRKVGNAGSFFRNPFVSWQKAEELRELCPGIPCYPVPDPTLCKVPAGWLIEAAGMRGVRRGAVGTWPQQALVLVNYGGASAHELMAFAEEVAEAVLMRFGVALEPEVRLFGAGGEMSWQSR
ncbi:MAG: UDP-N-acetylmuramate dehydrogenase [Succinivibrionaceae bacterium]|nr:UDP-N-acetylmuramate dehydrogenase [Succinivibrionaceae bacterium]